MLENKRLQSYATARDRLLENIAERFIEDDSVIAAWATGSLAKGKEDSISDVDLTVVLTDEAAEELCKRPFQESGRTTPKRFELFIREFSLPLHMVLTFFLGFKI